MLPSPRLQMARAVVTGGAGFLGSHVCERLLKEGYEVVCIDNFLTGSAENLRSLEGKGAFSLVRQDVSKHLDIPGPVDAVLHFASPASPDDYLRYPIQTLKAGALGTHTTLGLAKAKGASYMLASTSEVYGDPLVNPQTEDYWGNVNPIGPRGVYDEAKRYAEAMTMAYHRVHGIDTRIARIFNSVAGSEPVVLLNNGRLHIEPIDSYVESRRRDATVLVPCFDPSDSKVKRFWASDLIRIPFRGRVFRVRTTYGREVTVTGDHSLFTHDQINRPVPIPVRRLKRGMRIAVPARLDIPSVDVKNIDLADHLMRALPEGELWQYSLSDPCLRKQVIAKRKDIYRFFRERSSAKDPRSCWGTITRWKRSGNVPLSVVRAFNLVWSPRAKLGAYSGGARSRVRNRIEITNDLLWLFGLYLAEGSHHRGSGNHELMLSSDTRFVRRARGIMRSSFGVHVGFVPYSRAHVCGLYVHSKPLFTAFMHIFDLAEKRIPRWVLQLPLARAKHFLEGYKDGDGTHSGQYLWKILDFNTTSRGLALDLNYLLLRFGIVACVGRYFTTFKQKYGNRRFPFYRISIRGLSNFDILTWDKGVDQNLQRRRGGDIVWALVKSIHSRKYRGFVYDLSVPGAENFIAGTGVFCHNTYGPRMRLNDGRVIPNFVYQALKGLPLTIHGDGKQTRSFCYVDDMVEGLWRLLRTSFAEPVNLGNPNEITILELANRVRTLVGSKVEFAFKPLPQDDPRVRCPDISRARELLKWEPKVGLEDGLHRTIEFFRGKLHG